MAGILWGIVAILVIAWLVSFVVLHVTSGLIHLILVVAVVVLIYNLVVGSRAGRRL
ncbi:MAG: hypothetical protein NVS2B12_35130 [Ktedonobacteraceae bacterium]